MPPAAPATTAAQDAALAAAHAKMVREGTVQFTLPGSALEKPHTPAWLEHLLHWLSHRPVELRILFWAGVAAIVLIVGKLLYDTLSQRALDFRTRRAQLPEDGWWRPDAARARVLLAQADALAEAGRFEEAAHLLLLKSVDDIDERRPGELRPSLTARDIARLPALPGDVRQAFGLIAGVVETSLFGGAVGRARGVGARARCLRRRRDAESLGVSVPAAEAERPLIARAGIAVAVAAAIAFAAYVALSAFADDYRSGRDGGAHALSVSATGFSGIAELLAAARPGPHNRIARDPFTFAAAPLLIVTPPAFGGLSKARLGPRDGRPTLIVLGKWQTIPNPTHPGWVRATGLLGPTAAWALFGLNEDERGIRIDLPRDESDKPAKPDPAENAKAATAKAAAFTTTIRDTRPGERLTWPGRAFDLPAPHKLQTLASTRLEPLLVAHGGGIVLGRLRDRPIYILADPDLLNNSALATPAKARTTVQFIDQLPAGNAGRLRRHPERLRAHPQPAENRAYPTLPPRHPLPASRRRPRHRRRRRPLRPSLRSASRLRLRHPRPHRQRRRADRTGQARGRLRPALRRADPRPRARARRRLRSPRHRRRRRHHPRRGARRRARASPLEGFE